MVRQPKYSPTIPLMTRDPKMPVSRPLNISPTLRALFSGSENCDTKGMKIWGITEQTPVTSEAANTKHKEGEVAIPHMDKASNTKLTVIIVRRL